MCYAGCLGVTSLFRWFCLAHESFWLTQRIWCLILGVSHLSRSSSSSGESQHMFLVFSRVLRSVCIYPILRAEGGWSVWKGSSVKKKYERSSLLIVGFGGAVCGLKYRDFGVFGESFVVLLLVKKCPCSRYAWFSLEFQDHLAGTSDRVDGGLGLGGHASNQ